MLFVGHLTLGVLAFLLAQPYLIGNQVLFFNGSFRQFIT